MGYGSWAYEIAQSNAKLLKSCHLVKVAEDDVIITGGLHLSVAEKARRQGEVQKIPFLITGEYGHVQYRLSANIGELCICIIMFD